MISSFCCINIVSGCRRKKRCLYFFFFNDTATTEIYTLSLHDALPILTRVSPKRKRPPGVLLGLCPESQSKTPDRKSTRLNSSHDQISYAVFCLKKKKKNHRLHPVRPLTHVDARYSLVELFNNHTSRRN